jgi:hypothetical protein
MHFFQVPNSSLIEPLFENHGIAAAAPQFSVFPAFAVALLLLVLSNSPFAKVSL